ncbi:MAG: aspartyl/glutamyl-tRNA amidotransferase subunit C [Acidilobaceae archaeon]|nr:aspartyl/glutamyl-tRNA amidotransferase subunit C [Acidilobaceae archaeon]MDW7974184.1 aspartyl/glutamyl-tRNA amidotransferase subunit C [Sulfolobales archaeon]
MECKDKEVMEKLVEIAKISLNEEERKTLCDELSRIAEYLKAVGEAARELGTEPLYYVWDLGGPLRDGGESHRVDVRELPTKVKDGHIAVPWRGGRVEE